MQSKRRTRRWHRRIATWAAGIVLWLALSGLVLNHAADARLHERMLPATLANLFYGQSLPKQLDGYVLDGHWFTVLARTLYRDAQAIASCDTLIDARTVGDQHAVACRDAVYLFAAEDSNDGINALPERIDAAWGLQGDIVALGTQAADTQNPVLIISTRDHTWCVDQTLLSLASCTATNTTITSTTITSTTITSTTVTPTTALPAAARQQLKPALAAPAIDAERFVHDLHSGRLFGAAARWVWDLFALVLLALAITGLRLLRRR